MRRAGKQMIAQMRQRMKSRADPGSLSRGLSASSRKYASMSLKLQSRAPCVLHETDVLS